MIALDSNVLIYFLAAHPEFGPFSRDLLVAAEQTSLNAMASELIFFEILAHQSISEAEATQTTEFLEELGVEYKPVTAQVLQKAAALRRTYGFGAMDSLHLASAVLAKATHFVTNDKEVLKKCVPDLELVPLTHSSALLQKF